MAQYLVLGSSGTGKTHIALALGLAACQRGMRTRFMKAAALVHELMSSRYCLGASRSGPPVFGVFVGDAARAGRHHGL